MLAFLDIMPLSRGHILLTTRNHWEKVGDVGVRVGEEVSSSLLSRDLILCSKEREKLLIEFWFRLVNGFRYSLE